MTSPLRVFWQPGCSSCLKAKEFLKRHDIPFDSVNVLGGEDGMAALQALGAKSVPVVSRGVDFVFAQNLRDVADFVGIERGGAGLSPTVLVGRLDRVLAVAQSHVRQLPLNVLQTTLPGRDRTYLDLGYHIFVIPEAFLESANGGILNYEFFERRPPSSIADGDAVAVFGQSIRGDMSNWWESINNSYFPDLLDTYYGLQHGGDLLERTTWHSAQHTRQLAAVLKNLGISLQDSLSEGDLEGLPLPDHVYDDEVPLSG